MSDYDLFGEYEPERPATLEEEKPRPPRRKKPSGRGVYNLLAFLFLIGTAVVIGLIVIVVGDPTSPLNPFPPATPLPTPTLIQFDGLSNLPITPPITPSATRFPTSIPLNALTPGGFDLTSPTGVTPLPGATLTLSVMPFTLQNDAVTYLKHPDGCKGLWLVGQVFDQNNGPLPGLPVQVTGTVFQGAIDFTGAHPRWGQSGYEFELNSTPVEDQFVVQLLNTTGQPLSEPVVVKTLASCDQNMAVVNFIQSQPFAR